MRYVHVGTATATWAEENPWVLLGLCARLREDASKQATELTLRVFMQAGWKIQLKKTMDMP
jgi:hypothetical protein